MCGCKRRREARAAWLEQRAAGGGRCGRGFGPGAGPPFRPPFMGGLFGRWRDTPRTYRDGNPSQLQPLNPRDVTIPRDVEKATSPQGPQPSQPQQPPQPPQKDVGRVSFMSGPFSRWRDSVRSDTKSDVRRESTTTLPPRYASGVTDVPRLDKEKRESLPPTYDAATKY
ncbi:hypothetical protein CCHR01_07953 [Colletotrichum chrysophilum]|uniref:Uncharacterized protein n=1 Tax=Colletotrichum chrysophilum TaxID=1836956 RepID=A0AAD9EFH4_9PEZI|nr:hypothetical protein CCHR01_07953 [Colletotrichum chrysophilum]